MPKPKQKLPPIITSFIASTYDVAMGTSIVLSWIVTGATSLSLTGPGLQATNVTGQTSITVTPPTSGEYVLTAINQFGQVMKSVMVRRTSSYPTYVAAASWDARTVWDLQRAGNAGHRAANMTKVFGEYALPAGCSVVNDNFLVITGTGVVFDGWDFSTVPGGVSVSHTGSATFTDCLFKCGSITGYNLEVGDVGQTGGSATCSYCTFDGSNNGSSASNYICRPTATLNLSRCVSKLAQNDTGKSQGTFTADLCWYQPSAANPEAHLDGHQMDQGSATFTDCLIDGRLNTTSVLNNNLRAESNGGVITLWQMEQCVCVGQKASGGLDPFEVKVSNGNAIQTVRVINNLWERGTNGHAWYPGAIPAATVVFTGNEDFDTGDEYPLPN